MSWYNMVCNFDCAGGPGGVSSDGGFSGVGGFSSRTPKIGTISIVVLTVVCFRCDRAVSYRQASPIGGGGTTLYPPRASDPPHAGGERSEQPFFRVFQV